MFVVKLNAVLSGRLLHPDATEKLSAAHPLKLPPIKPVKRIVPETTYGLYGWRQKLDPEYKRIHELERQARPKCTITKIFKWPVLYV